MEYSKFSLEQLYMYQGVLENMKKQYLNDLEMIQPNRGENAEKLTQRIENVNHEIGNIIGEIEKRDKDDYTFSRELIFYKSLVENKILRFHLKPSSEAFSEYGSTIIGEGYYPDDEEINELFRNLFIGEKQILTHGYVRIKLIYKDFPQTKIDTLLTKGINTKDIIELKGLD